MGDLLISLARTLFRGQYFTLRQTLWPLLLAVAVCGALVLQLRVISTVNPVDFLVYRYAVGDALHGENLYGANVFGPLMPENGLPYTYTPFGLLALWPTTLFSSTVAFIVWSALSLLAFIWCMWRMLPRSRRAPWLLPVLAVAASLTSVVAHHLIFGQINVFLMALVLWDLTRSRHPVVDRFLPRGALVGVAAAIKLTPGLFMLFFLLTRQWRLFWASTVSFTLCTFAAGLVFPRMTWDFFSDTLWHLGTRVSLTGDLGTSGNNSITGLISAVGDFPRILTTTVLVLSAAGILTLAYRTHARGRAIEAWLIIGLAAPLLSPVSWIHHWVYLLPALCFVLSTGRLTRGRLALLSGCVLLFLVGPQGGAWLFDTTSTWLWPVAGIFRQSLMVASLILIVWLGHQQPAGVMRSAAPEGALARR